MVKFRGLDCEYSSNGEPITGDSNAVIAVFSFPAVIEKGLPTKTRKGVNYKKVEVDVLMRTTIDVTTPYRDWKISAQSFADIWKNACKRKERHIFEASMAEVGITFCTTGDSYVAPAQSLAELHAPREYLTNEL